MKDQLLTTPASKILELSPDRTRDLFDQGLLRGKRVGGIRLIDADSVVELAERRKRERAKAR